MFLTPSGFFEDVFFTFHFLWFEDDMSTVVCWGGRVFYVIYVFIYFAVVP
jgi:hypothetical protein